MGGLTRETRKLVARNCEDAAERDLRVHRETLSLTVEDNSGGSSAQGHGTILEIDYGLQTHQHLCRPLESQICFSSEPIADLKVQLRVLGHRPGGSLLQRKPRKMRTSLHRRYTMDSVTRPELVCSHEISNLRLHARDMRGIL